MGRVADAAISELEIYFWENYPEVECSGCSLLAPSRSSLPQDGINHPAPPAPPLTTVEALLLDAAATCHLRSTKQVSGGGLLR